MSQYKKRVDWLSNTNIYEVNIRQYTDEGSFNSFAKHLPRLKEMGVHVLWMMPITPIAFEKRKGTMGSQYACADYTSINPEFGTLDDFKSMVETAHEMGFKVIIDWVANHTGWGHTWTISNPDFYKRNEDGSFKTASGMDDIIELNYENVSLRKAMIAAMQFWIDETNIDGFRCDLAAWVTVDFWKEARVALEKNKALFWLGEFDELDQPEYGQVFDASYSWAWMHLTKDFADGKKSLNDLWDLLKRYNSLGDDSMRAWFTSNHDENSWNGTEYEKYGSLALPLAVFSATWNGVPLIYNGQELPLLKRLQFFDKDAIQWSQYCVLQNFYQLLNDLKKNNKALRASDTAVSTYIIETNEPEKLICFSRKYMEDEVFVLLNFSADDIQVELKLDKLESQYTDLFSGNSSSLNSRTFLKAYEYRLWYKK
ncbi:MAG: 1,4-alpha-glucan branching protein [Chitinophagaceae bacterium]|nr:MAG: 1,4-alpha-glucan branching protein [Chitinophagaceae bacterium]